MKLDLRLSACRAQICSSVTSSERINLSRLINTLVKTWMHPTAAKGVRSHGNSLSMYNTASAHC